MNRELTTIKAIEITLAIFSTYLALDSFFSSSIYDYVTRFTQWLIESIGFTSTTNINPAKYMPLMISLLVFVYILYNSLIGEEVNTLNIFQINLMLLMPEVLSYSRLNFLNLIGYGFLLTPIRGSITVLLSAIAIISIYTVMQFISKNRALIRDLQPSGVDENQLTTAYVNQTTLSMILGLSTAFSVVILYYLVKLISPTFYRLVLNLPYLSIVTGLIFSLSIVSWIYIMFRESHFNQLSSNN